MKKSYTLLIVWMIVFCVAEVGLCFLPFGEDLLMRLTLNGCSIGIAVLTLIIYLTGYVYWYNGVKFQDAVAAGPARRKKYALRHLLRFGIFAAAYLLFSVIMQILLEPDQKQFYHKHNTTACHGDLKQSGTVPCSNNAHNQSNRS